MQGDFEAVGSEGFRRLADYIGGKEPKKGIHFNDCPRQPGYCIRKNCHDRPSQQARDNGRWRIAFMMPSAYTMNTLPIPDDDRIALREEKEKTVAVIRYSGTWGKKRYEGYANKLMEWISKKDWKIIGAAIWARYNPPFMPWVL